MIDIFEKCNNIIITDEMVDVKSWLSEEDVLNMLKTVAEADSVQINYFYKTNMECKSKFYSVDKTLSFKISDTKCNFYYANKSLSKEEKIEYKDTLTEDTSINFQQKEAA